VDWASFFDLIICLVIGGELIVGAEEGLIWVDLVIGVPMLSFVQEFSVEGWEFIPVTSWPCGRTCGCGTGTSPIRETPGWIAYG